MRKPYQTFQALVIDGTVYPRVKSKPPKFGGGNVPVRVNTYHKPVSVAQFAAAVRNGETILARDSDGQVTIAVDGVFTDEGKDYLLALMSDYELSLLMQFGVDLMAVRKAAVKAARKKG